MKNYFSKIAIILPIIVMLSWIFLLQLPVLMGTEIRLKIEGYDPRDILSGHYLQYQVNFDIPPFCDATSPESLVTKCVCLTQPKNTKEIAKATWVGNCSERPSSCTVYIQGDCQYSRFTAGIERFYFPETFKIDVIPKDANVVLKVLDGKASVQNIEVNGIPLLESKNDKS